MNPSNSRTVGNKHQRIQSKSRSIVCCASVSPRWPAVAGLSLPESMLITGSRADSM